MTVPANKIPKDKLGLDIGQDTVNAYSKIISDSKTVLWNGPMGVFELPNFAKGTEAVTKALANATDNGTISLVGGGDSVAAVNKLGYADKISHVSTGGGASLELISGLELPAVAKISEKE